jgi:Protein of unknown function (DUF1826)
MTTKDSEFSTTAKANLGAVPYATRSMSQVRLTSSAIVHDVVGLSEIYEGDCNVVEWQRHAPLGLELVAASPLVQRDFEYLARVDADGPPGEYPWHGLEDSLGWSFVRHDIAYLVEVFATLFELSTVGVRIASTSIAPCPRFHIDNVGVRLICAYAGAGTEWLDNAHVDRKRLGHLSGGQCDEESGLIRGPVEQMRSYSVGLLKGEGWEGNKGSGLVHRSPEYAGRRRLVLTLDALV